MKTYIGKTNGKAFKGIYTNSCMPNQKTKRIKKDIENMNPINDVKININLIGIFSAIITAIQAPLDMKSMFDCFVSFNCYQCGGK